MSRRSSSAFILPPTWPKPLHFGLFAHNALPLPLGPNSSEDVPRELATCLIGTQQPWLAPRNSHTCSSNLIHRPTGTTRSAAPTFTSPHLPMRSPSGFIFTPAQYEPSFATYVQCGLVAPLRTLLARMALLSHRCQGVSPLRGLG